MHVFLAGATGFVGGSILDGLVAEGHEVTGLARDPSHLGRDRNVHPLAGDISSTGPWMAQLGGHDAVINAVGLLRERGRQTFSRVVVEGTRNLVGAARAAKVPRFIQISANGIDAATVPYQTTKLEAERFVRASGLDWTIYRPSTVFGPRDAFTNRFVRMMRWGLVPYFGRGDYRLAPVASWDLAAAVERSLGERRAVGETFTVCGPESLSFKAMLRDLKAASGRRALVAPVPKWAGLAAAAALGRFPAFPADRDALRMLFQGNVCADDRWKDLFDIEPTPFGDGIRTYLRPPAGRGSDSRERRGAAASKAP